MEIPVFNKVDEGSDNNLWYENPIDQSHEALVVTLSQKGTKKDCVACILHSGSLLTLL